MAKLRGRMLELNQEGSEIEETLYAFMAEHFPSELQDRGRDLVWDVMGNCFDQSFLELAQLYRALVALMPDQGPQIRAAYEATVFEHERNDEEDWVRFATRGDDL